MSVPASHRPQDIADVEAVPSLEGGGSGEEDRINNDQLKHIASALNAAAAVWVLSFLKDQEAKNE